MEARNKQEVYAENSQKCLVMGRIIVIMHRSGAWLPFLIEFEKVTRIRREIVPVRSDNSSHRHRNLRYKYCSWHNSDATFAL